MSREFRVLGTIISALGNCISLMQGFETLFRQEHFARDILQFPPRQR